MPQSLSKVYVHITFSTKQRINLIDQSIEKELYKYIAGICKNLECYPIEVGGHRNHVHILCLLSKKKSQVELLKELKVASSKWMKTKGNIYSRFSWQAGYGIFSVNPSEIDKVVKYIQNQEEHHQKWSFQDEFRAFLKKYKVDYDEKYVWD